MKAALGNLLPQRFLDFGFQNLLVSDADYSRYLLASDAGYLLDSDAGHFQHLLASDAGYLLDSDAEYFQY